MDLKLKIDERTFAVSVPTATGDGPRRLVVDGTAHELAATKGEANAFAVTLDGKRMVLHVARAPEGTWVWCAGRARLVRDAAREERRGAKTGAAGGAVTPAFPSVVVALLVKVGDEVRKGQALVVISAMKMESRLVAPRAGKVRALRAAVGASVKPGDVLVELEPAAGGTGDE